MYPVCIDLAAKHTKHCFCVSVQDTQPEALLALANNDATTLSPFLSFYIFFYILHIYFFVDPLLLFWWFPVVLGSSTALLSDANQMQAARLRQATICPVESRPINYDFLLVRSFEIRSRRRSFQASGSLCGRFFVNGLFWARFCIGLP